MASFIGKFLMYKPTRRAFAVSSGSWTGQAANKVRPCLVIGVDTNGKVALAPLTSAHLDPTTGSYQAKQGLIMDHWSPIRLINRPTIVVPPSTSRTSRYPIAVNDKVTVAPPLVLRPSYVWVADEGESIQVAHAQTLPFIDALGEVDRNTLRNMRIIMTTVKSSRQPATPPTTTVLLPL